MASARFRRGVDPQQRLLVASFGALTVLLAVTGLAVALLLGHRVSYQTKRLAGTLMGNAVHGHLQRQVIGGQSTYTAPPPSDEAWWRPFRQELQTMLGAEDVDVLDSAGTVVLGAQASEVGVRFIPDAAWRAVVAGKAAQYLRSAGARTPIQRFVVVVPVTFVPADGGPPAMGAVSVELDAGPILGAARDARNLALIAVAAVLAILLVVLWFLTRRLSARAYRDPLTNLPNRRYFAEATATVLAHNERHKRSTALLYADINRFGAVNASLGYRTGDEVLRSVAHTLARNSRAGDTLARIGGDDFALLLNEATPEQARLAAERVTTTLETSTVREGDRLRITLSIGIAIAPQHGRDIEQLLQHADTAMREARRNHIPFKVYDVDNPFATSERLGLEADLRDALLNHQIHAHYQPIVTSNTTTTIAYEALARWNAASGPISPATFIPIAENTGLIRQLDRHTYHAAIKTLAAHQQTQPTLRISVNLSASSLADPSLPADLRDIAEQNHIPPRHLTLEVTESAAIDSLEGASNTLQALRDLGFYLALDDFGTGYSSLAYLRTLPIAIVKIDRHFITGIGHQTSDETLIRAIISYAKSLGIRTLAEGVETPQQHHWLLEQGVDLEQGYLHGKPAPLPQPTQA